MATFINQTHSIDRQRLRPDSDTATQSNCSLEMRTISESSDDNRSSILVALVFILEFLLLVFLAVVEYFLRFTNVFPVRHEIFSCTDPELSYKTDGTPFKHFQYKANVPFVVIISLSFCLPPVIIILGELCLWAFSTRQQKTIKVLCSCCRIPQICRRMIRYIGAFLFGLLMTMIITDVVKLMTGRLRPSFIEVCQPNITICTDGKINDENICTEKDRNVIREARLSFPSMHAAMTAYAAGFLATYMHNVIQTNRVRLLRPFSSLGFIILAVLCSLQRLGYHHSHVEDVACGFTLGLVLAVYMTVFVLNNFREHISEQALYNKLKMMLCAHQSKEYKSIRDEHYEYYHNYGPDILPHMGNMTTGIQIPRPQTLSTPTHYNYNHPNYNQPMQHRPIEQLHIERNTSNLSDRTKRRQQNTFQRDLARTLQYMRTPDDDIGQSHM